MQNPHFESDAQNWHIIGTELVSIQSIFIQILNFATIIFDFKFLSMPLNKFSLIYK